MAEECFECNIAGAIAGFKAVCQDYGLDCGRLYELLEAQATPEEWIKGLYEIRDRAANGEAREAFDAVLGELCRHLEKSPYAGLCRAPGLRIP